MSPLLADRFAPAGAAWIDLATGATVRMRLAPAGDMRAQYGWSDRCATLAVMRHPLMNILVDYGMADAQRTFEAYSVGAPIRTSASTVSIALTHVVRFLQANGLPLTPDLAPLALRQVERGPAGSRMRPLGILLQRRHAVEAMRDVLVETSPGGVTTVDVAGVAGSGLRTARIIAARLARLEGYVPVCGALLHRYPWAAALLAERHVCVFLDDGAGDGERRAVAKLFAALGISSARRHVFIRFRRTSRTGAEVLHLGGMGVAAMTSMVFVDRDLGPTESELLEAARGAGGNPGMFLKRLRAARFDTHVPEIVVVHESTPPYLIEHDSQPAFVKLRRPKTPISGSLADADGRAIRLAARGRHASAVRLLTRAIRVLEARGEPHQAGRCAAELGWILRDRGRTDAALEQFHRARALAPHDSVGVAASIAIGVTWTDERRLAEAEAALRAAAAAADVLGDSDLRRRAAIALGRCLYWQNRFDEGLTLIRSLARAEAAGLDRVVALALLARLHVAAQDLRGGVSASSEALRSAESNRAVAVAARAMAVAQTALGDREAVRAHVQRGLEAACAAHLPLVALRLRATLISALAQSSSSVKEAARIAEQIRFALSRRPVPPLLRAQLETASKAANCPRRVAVQPVEASLTHLQQLLEVAHAASDDHAAAEEVCRLVCDRVRAATVQIVTASSDHRLLARAGRPWAGDYQIVEHVLARGSAARPMSAEEPWCSGEIIRFAAEPVAVLVCRWSPGSLTDHGTASAVLRAAALAVGASVRALLERARSEIPQSAWNDLIGSSPETMALRDAIARAARAPFPILVEGESGSGKELVARAIHRLGPRRERRLCAINCAAVSDDLVEAELFGHARGAFTGAIGERAGLFEEADGGTLFLDEIGELSPRAQAKLLRVLQDGEVRRVGENVSRRVDARIIAATNRRLEEETENGRFRTDLRFRLDVVRITVPPLRDRATDIPALAAHFWDEAARRVGSRATLTPEAIAALTRYDWPGNVRQLQNAMASLAVHAPRRGRILPSMLPAQVAGAAVPAAATFEAAREEFERRFVRAALARAGGQRARAARTLGMSRQGLAKMMRRLRIDLKD